MNLLYAVTCMSVIAYLYQSYSSSVKASLRVKKYVDMVDELLPRLLPQLLPKPTVADQPESTANEIPPGVFTEATFLEFEMRDMLEKTTLDVLKAQDFSLTYEKAQEIAEDVMVGLFASKDQPLSQKVMRLVPTGEGMTVPPMQAPIQEASAPVQ